MWAIARPLPGLIDDHFTQETLLVFRMSRTLQAAACPRAIAERMNQPDAYSGPAAGQLSRATANHDRRG